MSSIARRAAIAAAAAGVVLLSGCSSWNEAHSYNAPAPGHGSNNVVPTWVRIDSPYNYPTIMHTCVKGDGIYELNDSIVPAVIPNDPACK